MKYQVMNQYGTTICGLVVDNQTKTYTYYPRQNMVCCVGKRVSKRKINELLLLVRSLGYVAVEE